MNHSLKIFNLFPRYYKNIKDWEQEFEHIKSMGFNTIYINPFHYTGFSGSLYAVKDYYRLDPICIDLKDNAEPFTQLANFLKNAHAHGFRVIMDLVINHSSKDCVLVHDHPDWYLHDQNNQLHSPGAWENGTWISWGDLAQFDHFHSPDQKNLWKYFINLVCYYIELGFDGFRADAAYQIPKELWTEIITHAKKQNPHTLFIAESLGGQPEQSLELIEAGFDYLCNSGKWWDFEQSWFIDQYNMFGSHTKTISFPENHDTQRIALECNSHISCVRRSIAFTGLISSSWMILTGTEFGWLKKTDVVHTQPSDREEINYNIESLILAINNLRDTYGLLNQEGSLEVKQHDNMGQVLIIEKRFPDQQTFFTFVINKSYSPAQYNWNAGTYIFSSADNNKPTPSILSGEEVQLFIN